MTLPKHAPSPELYVSEASAAALKDDAGRMPSWDLTPRQICDLELLMWRRFASQHARGPVQQEKHIQGRFRKQPVCSPAAAPASATIPIVKAA